MLATVIAAVGAKALWLVYVWLLSTIIAQELSRSKGYGEKVGLGTGLFLSVIAVIIWVLVPAKAESPWRQKQARKAAAVDAAELAEERK